MPLYNDGGSDVIDAALHITQELYNDGVQKNYYYYYYYYFT
jgi:hypothetical protein